MKEITQKALPLDILAALSIALEANDMLSVVYRDSKGNVTERVALVDEIDTNTGNVRLYTEKGFRTFKIANIQSI